VLATRLGLPFERIHLVQGDSDQVSFGGGTGGSRSLMMSGAAITQAADLVIKKGRELAGEHLETAPQDIEFKDGRFSVAGTDRGIGLLELSKKNSGKLDVAHITEVIATTYPNGCHVCEVEIDPETGRVAIARYSSVNDFGHLVNPRLVEGQVHGGVVQGLGQALMEEARYDDTGQLLTGSFMDYALPRAGDLPAAIGFASHPVPATTNPLGVKGCGEAGCAGALTSVMNAIVDALGELGIRHFDMPASPQRVWAAIQQAKS
jgi:carbon-monoxide dehydrogenase large subunit